MPKGNPSGQTIASEKYQKKAGYKTKGFKLKGDIAERFALACEKAGVNLMVPGTINTIIITADVDPLADADLFGFYYDRLPGYRREKIDRIRFPEDKRQSLGAWVILEMTLRRLGADHADIAFGENGKPYLPERNDIKFNISHSGSKVMCAVSDHDIGCDVEKIKDTKLRIARRFFNEAEYAYIENCPDPESQKTMFFRLWTLKESFMKVTGLGFKLPLNEFCIQFEGDSISVVQNVDDRDYYFKEYDLGDGYRYAVCSAGKEIVEAEPVRIDLAEINGDWHHKQKGTLYEKRLPSP